MAGLNKAIIIGHVGKEPESRTLESGTMVVNFTVATSEVYKDRVTGERKQITDWHNVVAWRGLAETASKYLHKGDQVSIVGKMRTRSWEKDGVTRYTTEIIADELILLTGKKDGGGQNSGASYQQPAASVEPEESSSAGGSASDDLPF